MAGLLDADGVEALDVPLAALVDLCQVCIALMRPPLRLAFPRFDSVTVFLVIILSAIVKRIAARSFCTILEGRAATRLGRSFALPGSREAMWHRLRTGIAHALGDRSGKYCCPKGIRR